MTLKNQGIKRAGSRSDTQSEAETYVLVQLSQRFGLQLVSGKVDTGRSFVQLDGLAIDRERSIAVAVEVFAHVGRVKAAQRHKVHADVFKLALVRSLLLDQGIADVTAVFAFTCLECARSLTGRTWIADAASRYGVQSVSMEIPTELTSKILEAQARQNLIETKVEVNNGDL